MKFKDRLKGLMMFLFYSASSNAIITLMACSVTGIIFIVTGNPSILQIFILMVVSMPSFSIISSIAGGYVSRYSSNWDRYQASMPVNRKDIIYSKYLCIVLASIAGIPVIAIVTILAFLLHKDLSSDPIGILLFILNIASMGLSIILFTGAIYFPLTCMKISKNKGESLAIVCMFVSIGIVALISWLGYKAGFSKPIFMLTYLLASVVFYIFSYFFTKKLFIKLDVF